MLTSTLAFVVLTAGLVAAALGERAQVRADLETTEVVRSIERRMDMYLALLRGAAALFASNPDVDREGFRRFERRLRREWYPGIQGTGWTVRLRTPQQAERIVAEARASGVPDYRLWPEHDGERHAIVYLEPQDLRNRTALGYDMHHEEVRRVAMDRARDTGLPSATGQVTLVQEIGHEVQPGFLVYVPVYDSGLIPPTLEERREQLRGFVYAPFRAGDLFGAIFQGWHDPPALAIHDGPEVDPDKVMFALHRKGRHVRPDVRQVSVAGRMWTIEVKPHLDLIADGRVVGSLILVLGTPLALMLARTTRARNQAALERGVALESLTRESQLRETFLGVLGHDLRNPLAAAKIAAQTFMRRCANDEDRGYVTRMEQSVSRAIRLVEQLLDLTRARVGGGLRIDPQPMLLAPLLRDIVHEAVLAAGQDVDVEISADEELVVEADADRLAQILSNLTSNAITYGQPPIHLQARRDGGQALITLTNRGTPIPPAVLASLFDPFTRADASTSARTGGLGLGLYISRQLALAHRGSLEARSDEEETAFELRLPLA